MSNVENFEFPASNSKEIKRISDCGSFYSVGNSNAEQADQKSREISNRIVDDENDGHFHMLLSDVSTLMYPSENRSFFTDVEIQRFLDRKPTILAIVCGTPDLELVNDANILCINFTSSSAWRKTNGLTTVHSTVLSLANAIGKVVVIGQSSPASKDAEFEMIALAASLRKQSKALVGYVSKILSSYAREIDTAFIIEGNYFETPGNREYLPLGYRDKTSFFWSFPRKCILEYSPADMTNPGTLTLLCGYDWLRENYGYLTNTGQIKVNYRDVGVKIMEECSKKGLYRISNTYGAGVWLDSLDQNCLIVNNGDNIWRTDGRVQPRVGKRFVYTASRTLNFASTEEIGEPFIAQYILDVLNTWSWRRPCEPVLVLGWIAHAVFTGANDWRVHASITGKKGTGKSSLLTMIRGLLGDFVVTCSSSSTEPSIRRQIKHDALAIIVDEAEKDSPNIRAVMSYLRASSSGDKDMKANRNDGVDIYRVRSTGLISGIDLPQFLPADEGRYIQCSLVGAPITPQKPHMATANNSIAQEFGAKLKSRMIHSWPRYQYCLGVIRSILVDQENMTQRYADSLSTILGAAWIALNDGVISEAEARQFIGKMDFSEEKEQLKEAVVDSSFMDHALDTVVNINLMSKIEKITLRMAVERAAKNERSAGSSIQMYGLRITKDDNGFRLLIDEKNSEFKKLFRDTKWCNMDFATAVKRLPGASPIRHKETYIGGKTVRPFSIPFDVQRDDD